MRASTFLHVPWCSTPYVEDEAWAYVREDQPCAVTAVSGPAESPTFVALP